MKLGFVVVINLLCVLRLSFWVLFNPSWTLSSFLGLLTVKQAKEERKAVIVAVQRFLTVSKEKEN